jgi:hypothetical protein
MSEARCIHDFLTGQCGHCKPPPFGINEVVFTTKGGQVFHMALANGAVRFII